MTRALQADEAKGGGAYIKLVQSLSNGTDGGSASGTSWNNRLLTNLETNAESLSGVSLNVGTGFFTLPTGTYRILAHDVVYNVTSHVARLYNASTATTVLVGTAGRALTGENQVSVVSGQFTVSSASDGYSMQHWTETTKATDGLGRATDNQVSDAVNEIFSIVELWKVG